MKIAILIIYAMFLSLYAQASLREVVYVETNLDSDQDGKLDKIYVNIRRLESKEKLPTMFVMSPYSQAGYHSSKFHNVDMNVLPQEGIDINSKRSNFYKKQKDIQIESEHLLDEIDKGLNNRLIKYARITADSLGTGKSEGCPSVGGMDEALAGKAVIDWLNGRAKAYNQQGMEVKANWSNGKVGMTGLSYLGTLPIMVASTGVEGLEAIISYGAISNWYNYYRSNGLVVAPGGYQGEDADVLFDYIIGSNSRCNFKRLELIANQDRVTGDYNEFWDYRNFLPHANKIKAATFLIHGQADENVKQRHAVELFEVIPSETPKWLFLHPGGHTSFGINLGSRTSEWFAKYVAGKDIDLAKYSAVTTSLTNNKLIEHDFWPSEQTTVQKLFLGNNELLQNIPSEGSLEKSFIDNGNSEAQRILKFKTIPFNSEMLLSGTPKISLELTAINSRSANISVALFEVKKNNREKFITHGWADPQNDKSISEGSALKTGEYVTLNFDIEPISKVIEQGSSILVKIFGTSMNYTLRPKALTEVSIKLNENSYIELNLGKNQDLIFSSERGAMNREIF